MDLNILNILREIFDLNVLEEDERSLFSDSTPVQKDVVQRAIIKLVDSVTPKIKELQRQLEQLKRENQKTQERLKTNRQELQSQGVRV
jgi:hypothetical protein